MTPYDPWKRVDELEAKVRELEVRLALLESRPPAHELPVVGATSATGANTLHLPKGKH